jgi:exodeoxyribonuclease-3
LPGDPDDTQSRYIEAAVKGILIGCLYGPNGNPQPGPKFDYKLAWLDRLLQHAKSLLEPGVPVVLAGVPMSCRRRSTSTIRTLRQAHDVQSESRAVFRRLLAQRWTDAIRALHPKDRTYTWSYLRNRWPRDAGLRLDHLLLSSDLAKRLVSSGDDKATTLTLPDWTNPAPDDCVIARSQHRRRPCDVAIGLATPPRQAHRPP